MKIVTTLVIMFIAAISAVYTYNTDISNPTTDIDLLTKAISNYGGKLPNNLYFITDENRDDIYVWARYVLAPRKLFYKNEPQQDTILAIQPAASSSIPSTQHRKLIWEYRDSKYYYTLLKTEHE